MSRRPAGKPVDRATWQVASVLLDYPGEELDAELRKVRTAVAAEPALTQRFGPFLAWLDRTDPIDVRAAYVATFDDRRRCNPYLTYFAHGDTRKRGLALLRFKQAYRDAGVTVTDAELPDHLSVVLEFAATVDAERGLGLMLDHRAGLEVLRLALAEQGSPWAGVVAAVCATLPPLRGEEWEAIRRLAAEGPPEEEVGLTPYATPGFDPGPAQPAGPTPLPMPSFPGAR